MDNELVTPQKGIDQLPKPEIGFEFLQLPQHAENMKEEIEKRAKDALSILGEMGLQFSQKIPLKIVDESSYIDEFYDSTESYHKDLMSFARRLGQIRLKKDGDGKWRDEITMPINVRFTGQSEKDMSMSSLVHELAHLWMFQETQFGKEIFPLRERIAQQRLKDHDGQRKVVIAFGEINPEFKSIISDEYFRTLSGGEQFDAVTESLQDMLKEVIAVYEIHMEAFSSDCTTDSFERAKKSLDLVELSHKYALSSNGIVEMELKNMAKEYISQLKKYKSEDENIAVDCLVHAAEVKRDNALSKKLIEKLFLEKGVYQFYPRMRTLMEKIEQGNNVGNEVEKLEKDIVSTADNVFELGPMIDQYISESRMVNPDEIRYFHDFSLFMEGFSRFVEEKFIDESRRRNPDVSDVLGHDKMNIAEAELFGSPTASLLPYIKGLARFKSKYSSVREAMEGIRAMSIEEIQKEFLS